ncbi:MAG TPA: SDR family NAD(P)-dependent oxidoreductase [Myxococcota bacterium]|nr:SDR family NAD(P)-dependent oxidoreductase [Myxococcota bacterium]
MGWWRKVRIGVAELTVVGSYGRWGFRLRSPDFEALPSDLSGERHAITGASSGIGLAAAKALAERGATVVLIGRDPNKLEAAAREVPGAELVRSDLSDLDAAKALAELLASRPLTSLVHNAGFIVKDRRLTAQGHESAFATHVLSPFILTRRLSSQLAASAGRVVWVSSGGMYTQRLDLVKMRALDGPYDGVKAYAQHKRAQVILSESFQRRFEVDRLALTSAAMHPGWVDTPGVASGIPKFHEKMQRRLRTPEEGADTIVWLCAQKPAPEPGRFYLDRVARKTEVLPWTRHTQAEREALWRLCEELTAPYLE